MKELQAGIQLVRAKGIQLNQRFKKARTLRRPMKPIATKALPQYVSDSQKPLLSFPVSSSLEVLRQRTTDGLRRLESQAKRINQLSAELEAAVFELKAIASEINPDWRAMQATHKSSTTTDVCKYHSAVVVQVEPKQDGSFVLKSKSVDLFKAEREAALLAQTLRHRAKKKRSDRA